MKKVITFICLCLLPMSYLGAEGYQVNTQSAKQAAMGHVGAAMKLGAESMHFNPAGLAFMESNVDLSAGIGGVFTHVKYSLGDYSHKADNDPSTPMFLYAGFKVYDNLAAGISVNTPYGSAMKWGVDWPGASLVQDISLKAFSIQPTLSWKIMDRLSVGAGMMIMFGDFSLSRALLGPGALEGLRINPDLAPILDKYLDVSAASATLSGNTGVKLGFNVGAMFDINEKFTLGVSYRSKVKMKVGEGHAVMNYANELEIKTLIEMVNPSLINAGRDPIVIPPLDAGTFEAELPLPSNFNVGLTYKPNDKWLVSGEVQFVGWGAYKALNVQFSQAVLNGYSINAPKEYENTRIYRVGGQYAVTNRFDLRLGAYFDESPVKDNYLNPETPSMNKLGVTTGFSFRPLETLSIDLALAYTTGFGRDGSYTDQITEATFGGHYDANAFSPTIGLSYSF